MDADLTMDVVAVLSRMKVKSSSLVLMGRVAMCEIRVAALVSTLFAMKGHWCFL